MGIRHWLLLLWTIGLWLAAIALIGASVYPTARPERSDQWLGFLGAAVSAILAILGTLRLIRRQADSN